MKKILLTLITVLMTALAVQADVTINSSNFPDANFRSYLLSLYPSGTITTSQINALTNLNVSDKNISSLQGIGYLTGVKYLECSSNNLTSLNLTSNTNLVNVYCRYNKLTYLNVNGLNSLSWLMADHNPNLTSITGLANRSSLTKLNVAGCGFTTLTITGLSNLTHLSVEDCTSLDALTCNYGNANLSGLEVSGCTALTYLNCYGNPNLTSITGLSDCDNLNTLYCQNCGLTGTLDLMELPNVTLVNCSGNQLTKVNCYGKPSIKNLDCSYNKITSMSHGTCRNLQTLNCAHNQATTLTLSNCEALATLYCGYNQFTTLDFTYGMGALDYIACEYNTSLTSLKCNDNKLTALTVYGNTALKTLYCYSNPNLSSIYGLAQCTSITDLRIQNCAFTSIDVSPLTKLSTFYCGSNDLTALNLYDNTVLKILSCPYNELTELWVDDLTTIQNLNISYNTKLETLNCNNNSLTALNVTGNTALDLLTCAHNKNLTSITGLASCTALYSLNIGDCNFSSISLSALKNLQVLNCYSNKLTTLNVSACTKLTRISCEDNKLTTLNVSACTQLKSLLCHQNQISGTGMTTLVNSLPQRTASDYTVFRVIYNTGEGNTLTAAQISTASQKYWFPKKYNGTGWVDATPTVTLGDADGDGNVTIGDVSTLIDYLLSGNSSGINLEAADCDNDGLITIGDVSTLIDYLLSGHW